MDTSPSGLQPRQLEGELRNAIGNKRRSSVQPDQTLLPSGIGTTPMTDLPFKRHRAGDHPGPSAPATAPAAPRPKADDDTDVPRPDVFEYFAQRAGRQKELQQEVDRLRLRETALDRRAKDAELSVARLQAELAAAAARLEGREAQLQLHCDQMEASLRREVERAAGMEVKLRAAEAGGGGGAAAASAAVAGPSGSADAAGASDADAARQLNLRVMELELAVAAAQAEAQGTARRLEGELQAEQGRRQAEEAAAEALRRRVEEAEAAADAAAAARREAEARAAAAEAAALQDRAAAATRGSSEGDAVLIRSLREQLATAEAGAAEAGRLREQAAAAAALRERLDAAESRARCAEQLLEGESALHAELADAQAQLQRWTAVLSGVADCSTPEELLHAVKRLQDSAVAAAEGAGDRAEALAAARADAEAAARASAAAEAAASAAAARADAAEASLARAERRAAILTQERDSLKSVLASYDEEYLAKGVGAVVAGGGDGEEAAGGAEGAAAPLTAAQRRIAELEATVEALHGHVRSLEAELGAGGAAAAGAAGAAADAGERAAAAEARATAAEAEAEALARQVAQLQERVGRGEFNPETTKVLHLRSNPEAELARAAKDSRIAELESENDALRQNVQRLEAASTVGAAGTAAGGEGASLRVAQLEGEANLLRRRLAEAQKASDRLQSVFTRQIATFRDAIKGLFGYSVEMTSDPAARDHRAAFVLRPQHADEAGAELAFKMLRDGRIAYVPTEYTGRKLAREVETFVERYRSIPAFTANLTMENFQRHTQA